MAKGSASSPARNAPVIDIGIDDKARKQISEGLAALLADTYTLYLKTHAFHWNVEGPMFNTLHQMFMTQYTELWGALDLVAERIRSLASRRPAHIRSSASSPPSKRRSASLKRWRWCASW